MNPRATGSDKDVPEWLEKKLEDHETRLRTMEKVLAFGMGGLAVLNALGLWKLLSAGVGGLR